MSSARPGPDAYHSIGLRLFRQVSPAVAVPTESANEVRKRTGNQEILLEESQTLSLSRRVIGYRHASECCGRQTTVSAPTKFPCPNCAKL
jgi:hypothetical protein